MKLYADNPNLRAVREPDTRGGERVRFTGGRYGDHSLNLATRTEHEVNAHWAGYCENNDAVARDCPRKVRLHRHNKLRVGTVVARLGNEDLVELAVSTYGGPPWTEFHVVRAGTDTQLGRKYGNEFNPAHSKLPKKWGRALLKAKGY